MAQEDQDGRTALPEAVKLLLPLGALVLGALFVVAGAANLGFYDAFGIQDLRVVGIDKSAVVDHAVLFGVQLLALILIAFGLAFAVASASVRSKPFKERGRLGTGLQAGGILAALGVCAVWMVRNFRAAPLASVIAVGLMGAAVVARVWGARVRAAALARPWRTVGAALALVVSLALGAFFQGHAWGRSVRAVERTNTPILGFALIVQWPRGAVLDQQAEPCTDDILLGRSGGTYVLFDVRRGQVREIPADQPLRRVGLGAVSRPGTEGCPARPSGGGASAR